MSSTLLLGFDQVFSDMLILSMNPLMLENGRSPIIFWKIAQSCLRMNE